jgi:hypothetical protein
MALFYAQKNRDKKITALPVTLPGYACVLCGFLGTGL